MQTNFQKIQFEAVQASDGHSMRLDLSLPAYLARVTVGRLGTGQGYCDTEILNTETEEMIHWQHQEFGGAADLNAALTDFFSRLRDLPDADLSTDDTSPALPSADQNIRLNALLQPLLAVAID